MKKWTILSALVLVVLAATVASAAQDVMIHPNVGITVEIPKFGLVIPATSPWSFTLSSSDSIPGDGILFEAPVSSEYKLRVFSNTAVTVTLNDGRVNVGTQQSPVWFHPLYEWSGGTASKFWARGPDPANFQNEAELTNSAPLYTSTGAVANHEIALTGFKIYVSADPTNLVHADPGDASSPTNPDITQFAPVTASGTLIVTVAAAS